MRASTSKKFIIKNFDKFEYLINENIYYLILKNNYYTSITIMLSDSDNRFYNVCYWGNRKSLLWYFKYDFYFCANILRKSKSYDIDNKIINLLKSKKDEINSK